MKKFEFKASPADCQEGNTLFSRIPAQIRQLEQWCVTNQRYGCWDCYGDGDITEDKSEDYWRAKSYLSPWQMKKTEEGWCVAEDKNGNPIPKGGDWSKVGKVPITPHTGDGGFFPAKPDKPRTWRSFEIALRCCMEQGTLPYFQLGEGIPATNDDNTLTVVDIDGTKNQDAERRAQAESYAQGLLTLAKENGCYAEVSQSGKGYHIFGFGNWAGGWNKKEHPTHGTLEVYTNKRGIIMTGRAPVLPDGSTFPNPDRFGSIQAVLDRITQDYGTDAPKDTSENASKPSQKAPRASDGKPPLPDARKCAATPFGVPDGTDAPDAATVERVCADLEQGKGSSHISSTKLQKLWRGDIGEFEEYRKDDGSLDQSKADDTLMRQIVQRTQHMEIAFEVFRRSALGQREKAQRDDYLERTFRHAIKVMEGDMEEQERAAEISATVLANHAAKKTANTAAGANIDGVPPPPGKAGELAQLIYNSMLRQNMAFAIVSTLAAGAMAFQTRYFVNTGRDTGLNLNFLCVAPSAYGKSDIIRPIQTIVGKVPDAHYFFNKTSIAGGPAFRQKLSGKRNSKGQWAPYPKRSFLHVDEEIGGLVQTITSRSRNTAQAALGKTYLTLYDASSLDARFSDGDDYKMTDECTQPLGRATVSVLGTSVPESVFNEDAAGLMTDGFLNRFLIVRTQQPLPYENHNSGNGGVFLGAHAASFFEGVTGESVFTHAADYVFDAGRFDIEKLAPVAVDYSRHVPTHDKEGNAIPQEDVEKQAKRFFAKYASLNEKQEIEVEVSPEVREEWRKMSNRITDVRNGEDTADTVAYTLAYGRFCLHVYKIASILACFDRSVAPRVEMHHHRWAYGFVDAIATDLIAAYKTGELTQDDSTRLEVLKEAFHHPQPYPKDAKKFAHLLQAGIIPERVVTERLRKDKNYKHAREGASKALQNDIATLVREVFLIPISEEQRVIYNIRQGRAYMLGGE